MIDADTFRSVLGRFATGVTVVSASGSAGDCGMTVTSFCSLSLDPPFVLICIAHAARMHRVLQSASHFGVSVLRADQEMLARRFSDPELDRFDAAEFERGSSGTPVLRESLARLECRKRAAHDGGDHTVFIGEVESADTRAGEPLLYYRGGYTELRR